MAGLMIKRTMDTNVNTITFDHQKIGSLIRHGREYELKTIKFHEHHLTHEQAIRLIMSWNWKSVIGTAGGRHYHSMYEPKKAPLPSRWSN